MYRKDLLDEGGRRDAGASRRGTQVADIARKVNSPDTAGICLRGKPGWGDLGAAFTTVVNTFGGTWWTRERRRLRRRGAGHPARVQAGARRSTSDLITDAGEKDAANASFNECLAQYRDGKVAMWYDATVAAGLLEADDSPVKGKNGYAPAPVEETDASGWLWAWALAIPKTDARSRIWPGSTSRSPPAPTTSSRPGRRSTGGWAAIPPGTRKSTYEIPEYKKAAAAFAEPTLEAMASAPIDNPGTTKRPGLPGRAVRRRSPSSRTSATSARSSSRR